MLHWRGQQCAVLQRQTSRMNILQELRLYSSCQQLKLPPLVVHMYCTKVIDVQRLAAASETNQLNWEACCCKNPPHLYTTLPVRTNSQAAFHAMSSM